MTGSAIRSSRQRPGWVLGATVAFLACLGVVSAGFVILNSAPGAAGGTENGSVFLTDWQQTGVVSSATPAPVPGRVSVSVAAPSRLPALGGSWQLDAGVAGNQALEWTFTEAVGILTDQEIEVAFTLQYTVGTTAHTVTITAYFESQAVAIVGVLAYNLYWDAGAATGITFGAESEISQACAAVGTCP